VFQDERVNFLVGNVISEITAEQVYSEEQIKAMMEQIIYYTLRAFMILADEKKEKSVSRPEEFCYRIMNYIDTHVYTTSSLSDVAEALHYNYSYISDLFKKTTGETLSSYFRRRRLDAARLLLLEGKLSVTQISELLNFSSIYTFSRSYKDYFGVSPNESRRTTK
jgi:AraC-like DNA-binding protein